MYSVNTYGWPVKKKDFLVAVSDPRAHFGHFKDAIDFPLPEGTVVIAPKAGTVIDIKVDSKHGGADPKYNDPKFVNYLTLKHSNGEYSQYVHLKYKGVLVKVEQRVRKGQPVALSGNTGFSTAPHLHFQIFKLDSSDVGWHTLRPRFDQPLRVYRKSKSIPKSLQKTLQELAKVKKKLS